MGRLSGGRRLGRWADQGPFPQGIGPERSLPRADRSSPPRRGGDRRRGGGLRRRRPALVLQSAATDRIRGQGHQSRRRNQLRRLRSPLPGREPAHPPLRGAGRASRRAGPSLADRGTRADAGAWLYPVRRGSGAGSRGCGREEARLHLSPGEKVTRLAQGGGDPSVAGRGRRVPARGRGPGLHIRLDPGRSQRREGSALDRGGRLRVRRCHPPGLHRVSAPDRAADNPVLQPGDLAQTDQTGVGRARNRGRGGVQGSGPTTFISGRRCTKGSRSPTPKR